MRKLTYYVAVSLDGFIADADGGLGLFPITPEVVEFISAEYPETLPGQAREQLGLTGPGRHFDTIVQGRGSYALALDAGVTSPYPHLKQYVVSSTLRTDVDPAVTVIAADPVAAIRSLKAEDGGGIYLAGGGRLAGELLDEIDELILKVYPVLIGEGVRLFGARTGPVALKPGTHRLLADGTAILTYRL